MKSLLIENSTESGSVAVADDGEVLIVENFQRLESSPWWLRRSFWNLGAPDEIVVGIGPGSYTGLRVGSATAIGIQLALGCPAFGCPSVLGYPKRIVPRCRRRQAWFCFSGQHLRQTIDLGSRIATGRRVQIVAAALEEARFSRLDRFRACATCRSFLPMRNTFFGAGTISVLRLEPLYLKEPHVTVGRRT